VTPAATGSVASPSAAVPAAADTNAAVAGRVCRRASDDLGRPVGLLSARDKLAVLVDGGLGSVPASWREASLSASNERRAVGRIAPGVAVLGLLLLLLPGRVATSGCVKTGRWRTACVLAIATGRWSGAPTPIRVVLPTAAASLPAVTSAD